MIKKLLLPFLLFLVLVSKGQNTVVLQNSNVYGMHFINDNIGFVITDKILKTSDGGQNWKTVKNSNAQDIKFPSANIGYLTKSDSIFKTTDGGENWFFIKKTNNNLRWISCYDNNNCVICKSDSLIKTSDGGLTWTTLNVATSLNVKPFYFSSGVIHLLGTIKSPTYVYYNKVSKNFGLTWENTFNSYLDGSFVPAYFPNDSTGFVISNKSSHKTTNYGKTWTATSLNLPDQYWTAESIHGISDKYIMVSCSSTVSLNVGCSNDGGKTWTFKAHPENLLSGYQIFMSSLNTAWVAGKQGTANIVKMTNTVECFNTITSTSEIPQETFSIFPNPTQDVLNIATESPVNYFITELGGKQVLSGFGQSADVSSLSNGIYFISFEHQNQGFTYKFVKQ